MTSLREAAQQALEALEQFSDTKLVRTTTVIHDLRAALAQNKNEWQGLTVEEIAECDRHDHLEFARAIEAKLKEKNS